MYPNIEESPVKGSIAADVVFDMVYNPRNDGAAAHGSSPGKDDRFRALRCFSHRPPGSLKSGPKQPAPREVYAAE